MGNENPIHTLGDYSKPSHEGYKNTLSSPAPHDTQYCMKDPEQAFIEYAYLRTDEAGEGLVSNFMASQDARLSKFEADFKQQQSEMTNKINIVLKAITDRIAGTLPSDTAKNPKLSTYPVLSARSYPTEDPQCSTIVHGSINIVTICPKQPNEPQNNESEEEEQRKEGNPEDTNTVAHNKEQRDTPQMELKDTTAVNNLGPDMIDEGIEWLDIEEPLYLINTSEESVYESLIQEMPKCSVNYDFRIKRNGYEYMGRNFIGLGRDMHLFVGNMSYVMDFTILESEDDYDRGCRKPPDLEDGFYKDIIGNGYQENDKTKAKPDKTEHEIGKSAKIRV
ncbi:hypothetical protein Tco_0419314 [Tanacetum coccineum]